MHKINHNIIEDILFYIIGTVSFTGKFIMYM